MPAATAPAGSADSGAGTGPAAVPAAKKNTFELTLSRFDINRARIEFKDSSQTLPFETTISPLDVHVTDILVGEGFSADYDVALTTRLKETIASQGHIQGVPLNASGSFKLSGMAMPHYRPYYDAFLPFIVKSGQVGVSGTFKVAPEAVEPEMKVGLGSFTLGSFDVLDRKEKEHLVKLSQLAVSDSTIDLLDQAVGVGSIDIKDGRILLKRLKNGAINLADPASMPGSAAKNSRKPDRKIPAAKKEDDPASGSSKPWKLALGILDASGLNVQFKDFTLQDRVDIHLSGIGIKASRLNTAEPEKGHVDVRMTWNKKGRIHVKGDVEPVRSRAALDLSLEKLDIKSVQPYFTSAIKILVTDGAASLNGKVNLNWAPDTKQKLKFSGKTSLTDFVSLDKKSSRDFFKCQSLYVDGVNVSLVPLNVNIEDVSLTDFYSKIIISPEGELNLANIFNSEKGSKVPSEPVAEKSSDGDKDTLDRTIKVKNVTLQAGQINFSDFLTQPNYVANMKEITGSLKGLSSEEGTRAELFLKGLHGQSSPLDIVGLINPLAKTTYADVKISFKDIELTNFTPYAIKFLGYKIEKGKLILDLSYMIDGKKLNSHNRVRFDNFNLGEHVPSETATSLPVNLAISLLKDRNGQINLDLPVSGELGDPKFRIGSIVLKMISNIIVKAVTSPFSLIGSMFGSSDDLGYIEFDFGDSRLDDGDMKKLDTLALALSEKPVINLEIQGGFKGAEDVQALRQNAFDELIRTRKFKILTADGAQIESPDKVVVDELEKPDLIQQVYDEADFQKPMTPDNKEKKVDAQEQTKLLLANIPMGIDHLRLLAMDRAQAIKAYLMSAGKIQAERIFITEPKPNQGEQSSDAAARVIFTLK